MHVYNNFIMNKFIYFIGLLSTIFISYTLYDLYHNVFYSFILIVLFVVLNYLYKQYNKVEDFFFYELVPYILNNKLNKNNNEE